MPKRMRSYSNGRQYKKRRVNKNAGVAVRKPGLMGLRPTFNHAYFENVALTPGGTNTTYAFNANSLYDPNVSGVGHQALGFDQIKILYQHYCVMKARFKVTVINTSTTVPIYAGCCFARSTPSYSSLGEFAEQPNAQLRAINTQDDAGQGQTTFYLKINPRKWLGYKSIHSSNDLWGGVSADPTEVCRMNIFVSSQDEFSSPTFRLAVHIEYFTAWKEMVVVPIS